MTIIRAFEARDTQPVVRLSLRAWAPVFASLERVLGAGLFARLHTDWRADQQQAVEEVCGSGEMSVWVAETDATVVGFVALRLDEASHLGEIYMVAVDPDHQRQGVGTSLTEFALDQLQQAGMTVVMVETGGDAGHAPARATYERAGFTALPVVRYFKPLPVHTPDGTHTLGTRQEEDSAPATRPSSHRKRQP